MTSYHGQYVDDTANRKIGSVYPPLLRGLGIGWKKSLQISNVSIISTRCVDENASYYEREANWVAVSVYGKRNGVRSIKTLTEHQSKHSIKRPLPSLVLASLITSSDGAAYCV